MRPTRPEQEPARRFSTGIFPLVAALLALASVAQAQVPKTRSVTELRTFFQQNCVRCHGPDGSGRSADGRKLGGQDFTLAAQAFRKTGGPASEREIRAMSRTIRNGLFFGLSMPSWKDQLSPEEATLMVREILLKAEPGKPIGPELEVTGPR